MAPTPSSPVEFPCVKPGLNRLSYCKLSGCWWRPIKPSEKESFSSSSLNQWDGLLSLIECVGSWHPFRSAQWVPARETIHSSLSLSLSFIHPIHPFAGMWSMHCACKSITILSGLHAPLIADTPSIAFYPPCSAGLGSFQRCGKVATYTQLLPLSSAADFISWRGVINPLVFWLNQCFLISIILERKIVLISAPTSLDFFQEPTIRIVVVFF